MEWESSLGFPEKEGFRCGTCFEYSVFNIHKRKKLILKEKPLIVMDGGINYGEKNVRQILLKKY